MDGLLILALIGWAFFKMNKKAKKQVASSVVKEDAEERRARRLEQLRAEAEKRRAELAAQTAVQTVEGEGTFQPSFSAEEPFRGSMSADSTEGECICEPELEHVRETKPEPASVYAGEIGREPLVDFSSRGLMQGIVMSEILTRPAQRTRRR